jgi:hypothetical protein
LAAKIHYHASQRGQAHGHPSDVANSMGVTGAMSGRTTSTPIIPHLVQTIRRHKRAHRHIIS